MKRSALRADPEAARAWERRSRQRRRSGAQIKPRRPLRARSARREAEQIMRRELVAQILAERPLCEMRCAPDCTRWAVDVHEPLTRARGGSILDPANTVTSCRRCHDFCHDNPDQAAQLGLLVHSWEVTDA